MPLSAAAQTPDKMADTPLGSLNPTSSGFVTVFVRRIRPLPADLIAKGIAMKLILSLLLIGVSLFWNGISEADAQTVRRPQNCAPRDAVLTRLAKSYGEVQQSQGLGANNAIIEVFASEHYRLLDDHRHNAIRLDLSGCQWAGV